MVTVMGGVHLRETEEGTLIFLDVWRALFIPMTCHCKICVLIFCITCVNTNADAITKVCKILLEKLNDMGSCYLPSWKFYTLSCTQTDVIIFLKDGRSSARMGYV